MVDVAAFKEALCKSLTLDPEAYIPSLNGINDEFWQKLSEHLDSEDEKLKKSQTLSINLEKSLIKIEEHVHTLERTYFDTKKQFIALQKTHEDLHSKYTSLGM